MTIISLNTDKDDEPIVYSGVRMFSNEFPTSKGGSHQMGSPDISSLLNVLAVVDLPFSIVLDTVLLPATIPMALMSISEPKEAGYDESVKAWTSADGSKNRMWQVHSSSATAVAISPDNSIIATAHWNHTVKLWRLTGELITTLKGHSDVVRCVAFSPDGKTIITSADQPDKTMKLWDTNGKLLKTLVKPVRSVNTLLFSADSEILIAGSNDTNHDHFQLWTIEGKLRAEFSGHADTVHSVAISPDGRLIASASGDKTIKLWNIDGSLLQSIPGHTESVMSVFFDPGSQKIISGSYDSSIKSWHIDGSLIETFDLLKSPVIGIAISPDGRKLISIHKNAMINIQSFK